MSNANEPAFHFTHNPMEVQSEGLTKREYFAAMAMQALIQSNAEDVKKHALDEQSVYYVGIAVVALRITDTLLKQLNS